MKNLKFFVPAYKKLADAVGIMNCTDSPYLEQDKLDYLKACAEGKDDGRIMYDESDACEVIGFFMKEVKLKGCVLPWDDAQSLIKDAEPEIIKLIAAAYKTAIMNYSHPISSLEDANVTINEHTFDLREELEILRLYASQLHKEQNLRKLSFYIKLLICFLIHCAKAELKPSFE